MNQNQSRRGSSLCHIISSSGKCMSYLVSTGCDTLQPFCQQTWGTWWRLPGAGCAAYWFTDWLIGCWNQPSSRSSSPLWELKKHGCLECWETPVKRRKNPPTSSLTHILDLLSERGGLRVTPPPLAAEFEPTHTLRAPIRFLLGWETPAPTPPPPPPPPALHSVGGIHYNNKPHSFQGHSLTAREISDTDQHFRLSLPLRVSDAGRELMLV